MLVFYTDKVTCDTNIKGHLKQNEEITFQFRSHEVLQHQPPRLKHFSGCKSMHFWMENHFSFPSKDCTLLHVDFLSRQEKTTFRSNYGVMCFSLKFLSKIRFKRKTNLMQVRLTNQHQVITIGSSGRCEWTCFAELRDARGFSR